MAGPMKLKAPFWQSPLGIKMLTCCPLWPVDSIPLDGVKIAPCKLLLADQLRELAEPEADRVVVQVQPPFSAGQMLLFAVKLSGLAVIAGGDVQLHGTRL